jgi:hypothetical protein
VLPVVESAHAGAPRGYKTCLDRDLFTDFGERARQCNLTLRGSLTAGTVRIEETIGTVTGLTWGGCGREGRMGSALNLPWPMRLARLLYLTGTTCNIGRDISDPLNGVNPCGSLVTTSDVSFETTIEERRCLYGGREGTLGMLFSINLIIGRLGIWPAILITVGLRLASGSCGSTATLAGAFQAPTPEQFMTFS